MELDYQLIFEAGPASMFIFSTDFKILAVSNEMLTTSGRAKAELLGRNVFEVFPDNPYDETSHGATTLRKSLEKVITTKRADVMPVQRYDVEDEFGVFVERHWLTLNNPMLDEKGEVRYICHRVEEVTTVMRAISSIRKISTALSQTSDVLSALVYINAAK